MFGDAGWYPESGDLADPLSADVKEILEAAGNFWVATYKRGLTVTLTPQGPNHFQRGMWFISFNPPNLYFPHQWFWEASGSEGLVFNREQHGPRAVTMLADHLRAAAPKITYVGQMP